jgi:hypothetical protein
VPAGEGSARRAGRLRPLDVYPGEPHFLTPAPDRSTSRSCGRRTHLQSTASPPSTTTHHSLVN